MNLKPATSNSAVGQAFQPASSRNFPVPYLATGKSPAPAGWKACPTGRSAFSLVELLIVMTLLALIVLALMDVFSSTQRAFRASVTQSDILEGSRAAMDMITADLRKMTVANGNTSYANRDVNFCTVSNGFNYTPYGSPSYLPLLQSLPGSPNSSRTNLLQYFFILGRENTKWTGTGYVVDTTSGNPLYPLYRYHWEIPTVNPPRMLFTNFLAQINNGTWTNMSHLLDGVVHLVVRPSDANGVWLGNAYNLGQFPPLGAFFYNPSPNELNVDFSGAAVPGSVEVQMAVMEDRALARATSLPFTTPVPLSNDRRTIYLSGQSGAVHVFRQTVTIPNVDRSVYQ
ncbi:MAG: hypothetical protein P4N60_10245 [Verrucomicrobiae bacterium]|nr:hypothetical protein [Verrucomicrobiae bacterium]